MFYEFGWDGRIRTYGTLYQKQLPYHLATSQRCEGAFTQSLRGVQVVFREKVDFSVETRKFKDIQRISLPCDAASLSLEGQKTPAIRTARVGQTPATFPR